MTRQAQVGLFVVIAFIAIFAVFYVLTDFGTRARGYRVVVHFQSASGLQKAALVFLSGVPIGAVDDISLDADYTSRVTLAIKPGYGIPVGSRFIIQAPITGEPTVLITPPKQLPASAPTLAPLAVVNGTNPVSIADLLEQGQGEVRRLDDILAQLEASTPALLAELKTTLHNANDLTTTADNSIKSFSAQAQSLSDTLKHSLTTASNNVVDLSATLDSTVRRNSSQIDALLAQLSKTSISLGQTVDSIRELATNPGVKANLVETTHSFALTAKTLADLSNDLRQVTGNPQTQNQLRDTVAQLDATSQKVNSLVGSLGGKSSVYGVDQSATPAPGGVTPLPPGYVPTSKPAVVPSASTPAAGQSPAAVPSAAPGAVASLRARLNRLTKDLVELQVRVSQLSPERPGSADRNTSPLLTADRGPMSDFNLWLLPRASTGLKTGVNDVGANATGNFMLTKNAGALGMGAGIEYSRPGGFVHVTGKTFGVESRVYDLRHPTIDVYTELLAAPKFQLFGGERDLNHSSRRTVFGIQAEL